MAEVIKQQYDLTVLKICMNWSDRQARGDVLFRFEQGQNASEEFATSQEIGLPVESRMTSLSAFTDLGVRLPERVISMAESVVMQTDLRADQPLWIQLGSPSGNLTLLPWERLFSEALDRPVVRLPYFATQPSPLDTCLDIVLCISTPTGTPTYPLEKLLPDFVEKLQNTTPLPNNIHLFTDIASFLRLGDRLEMLSQAQKTVTLYDPRLCTFTHPTPSNGSLPNFLLSPWLRWISDSLTGRSVDVMHFFCDGQLSSDQGMLALCESPLVSPNIERAHFLGPRPLTAFLTHVGAWVLGLSSTQDNFSLLGLRQLMDQVACQRPGPLFLHDTKHDLPWHHVPPTYRLLLRALERRPSAARISKEFSQAVSLLCHPSQLLGSSPLPYRRRSAFSVDRSSDPRSAEMEIPRWIASSQRYLEQSVAELLETPGLETAPTMSEATPSKEGTLDALKFLADVLDRHSQAAIVATHASGSHESVFTQNAETVQEAIETVQEEKFGLL